MIYTFIQYLSINRGLSENTTKAYEEGLKKFATWMNSNQPGTRWSTVKKEQIDSYVSSLVKDGYKPATIKQHISALRTFYKTCMALGMMKENPAKYVSTPKKGADLPKVIERTAIAAALNDSNTDKETKAAIAIIYETGLRLQELLDLRPSNIDAVSQSIKIAGKGRKERTIYYGDLCKQYGRYWHGAQHTPREVRHAVFNALRPYSNAEQLSPHALRHTYATTLLNNGMSITAISKLMGHEHQETTEIYAKLATSSTRDLYEQYKPTL